MKKNIDDYFLTIAFGFRDLRLLKDIADLIAGLNDSDLEIIASYIEKDMEKDIEKIEELYLTYSHDVLYYGKFFFDVLKECNKIPYIDQEVEEEIKKEEEPWSSYMNDWIGDCCYYLERLKLVRKFVETHGKKGSIINNIKKKIYLYGREAVIWFCNMCMDLGYGATKQQDNLGWYAYRENKIIYFTRL